MTRVLRVALAAVGAMVAATAPGWAISYLYLDGQSTLEITAPDYMDATCDLAAAGNRLTGEMFLDVGADGTIDAADILVGFVYITDGIPHLGDWEIDWIPGDDDSVANGMITSRWYVDGEDEPPGTTQFILRGTDEDGSQAQAVLILRNEGLASATIEGHVTETGTGAPIESAWVWLESDTDFYLGFSGSDGAYSVDVVPGTYDVSAMEWMSPSHTPSDTVTVSVADGQTATADLQMDPLTSFIRGNVAYETRQGIPGVWLSVFETSGVDYYAWAVTDQLGAYSVGVVPGTYAIQPFPFLYDTGVPDGYYLDPPGYQDVVVAQGQTVTGNDFTAKPITSFIEGHTNLAAGGPLPNVWISATEVTTFRMFETYSDDAGLYQLGVAPGNYYVFAIREGYTADPFFIDVTVAEGQTVTGQDFTMTPTGTGGLTSIEGTVSYATRPPAENVYVVGWNEFEPSPAGWAFQWTDAQGFYRMVDVVPGDWLVAAYEPGYVAQPRIYDVYASQGDTVKNVDFVLGDVAVELESFAAAVTVDGVELVWRTTQEHATAGFNVHRAEADGQYARLNGSLITPGLESYAFVDTEVRPGIPYRYRLEEIGADGASTFYGPVSVIVTQAPVALTLHGAHPNPGIGGTCIRLSARSFAPTVPVELGVYDVRGSLVRTLVAGVLRPGTHALVWDGRDQQGVDVASGSYLIRAVSGTTVASERVLLVR
jgi:hypothetical protein